MFVNFFLVASIGLAGYVSLRAIRGEVNILTRNAIPAIQEINELSKIFLLSVEQAYSYTVLNNTAAKEGYYKSAQTFDQRLEEFKQLAGYGTPDANAIDTRLISRISEEWLGFNSVVRDFFADYEKTGVLHPEKVQLLVTHVDTMVPLFTQFSAYENAATDSARSNALSMISLSIIALCIAVALSLTLFGIVNVGILRTVLGPLSALHEAAVSVGTGDVTKRIESSSRDELGDLARAFNAMLEKLEKSRLVLEKEVADRTAELEKLKQGLEQAVAGKSEELQHKLDELERINKSLVGRELAMMELKKENDNLKKKAGTQ